MRSVLLVTEGRGQAVHLREVANINLLQTGYLAARFAEQGFETRVRLVLDGGQSPEEYSVLCHSEESDLAALRTVIEDAPDRREARRSVVRQIRETYLPFTMAADAGLTGFAVADDIFFAPLAARIIGVNGAVLETIRGSRHPLLDRRRLCDLVDEYEEILARHIGRCYLDLEETLGRLALERCLGDVASSVDIAAVSRPPLYAREWFRDEAVREVVESDLAKKELGGCGDDFLARLIGVFPSVEDPLGGRPYFNSPTCTRREHGKIRVLPRDRFGLLALAGSERMRFARLRELIERQSAGSPERLLGIKYPYTALILVRQIAREAAELARLGPVKVLFVEGVEGSVNPLTGGYIDQLFRELLQPGIEYHRFVARGGMREELPNLPGGLPLIHDRLARRIPGSFEPGIDLCLAPSLSPGYFDFAAV